MRWLPAGGLAIAAETVNEPFQVTAMRPGLSEIGDAHGDLESGPDQAEPNLLTRLLRHVYDEQLEAARRDWAKLVEAADADTLQALSGLRGALTALFGENWP